MHLLRAGLTFTWRALVFITNKASITLKPQKKEKLTPFEEFRQSMKNNLKIIKKPPVVKGEKSVIEYDQTMSATDEVRKVELPYQY